MNRQSIMIFIIVVIALIVTKLFLLPLLSGSNKLVSDVNEPID